MASVAKRGDKWTVRYVDHGGHHRQRTFSKKKDADLYRSKVETDLSKNMVVAERFTINAVADAFLRTMEQRAHDGRIGNTHFFRVELHIRLHIRPYIGNLRIDQVRLTNLEEWIDQLKAAAQLAPRTLQAVAQALKMIFDHAVKREWIAKNPVLALLTEMRGARRAEIATFSVDQVRAVLKAVEVKMYKGRKPRSHMQLRCAVHLATFCGLRLGEIFGLTVDNIDLDSGILEIRHSYSRRDGHKGPKSRAGVRDVAMPPHVIALLTEWLSTYHVRNKLGLVFTGPEGKPCHQDSFRHGGWGPLLVRAGLSNDWRKAPFHFHALRHFAASWMIDAGWSLPDVAKALGHAKVDMTMGVYAHALVSPATNADAMKALAARLNNADVAQIAHQPSN